MYDNQDRLQSYGNKTFTYTENGDLLTKTENNQVTTYNYDVYGNLLGVTLPIGTQIDYFVDGRGRRLGKKINGAWSERYIYQDDLRPAAKLNASGNVIARYIYGSDRNVPDYMITSQGTFRILSDHLGSPRLVMSMTGNIQQRMDYDEFGNAINDTNPGFQPFGFAGGLYDRDTGLVRFGARDYDPSVGRWTAKEPIRFGGGDTNLYGYVVQDPVNWNDPNGLDRNSFPYFPSREEHVLRNAQNRCPAWAPNPDNMCSVFQQDNGLLGATNGGKYRDSLGNECSYFENGELMIDRNANYTYNYGPNPYSLKHLWQDYLPHFIYGGNTAYTPLLTTEY